MKTEVVSASQLEQVMRQILTLRYPDALSDYQKELATYKRRLGKRREVDLVEDVMFGDIPINKKKRRGFVFDVCDQQVSVYRPEPPKFVTWGYSRYDRTCGFTSHAQQHGVLANAQFNRDIRPDLAEKYMEEMQAGQWHDLLSDPITITDDGQVINGQHRLAAACAVDWSEVENDPLFLVVFGVDPAEALHADGSRRTNRDERMIAERYLKERAA
jgi:hypothetical protein